MSARSSMVMRATVQRDVAQQELDDDYGHIPDWQTLHAALPCRYWIRSGVGLFVREVSTANMEAVIRDMRAICPVVDVTEGDRIGQITDRQGQVLVDGPLNIRGVERRSGHIELLLREVT